MFDLPIRYPENITYFPDALKDLLSTYKKQMQKLGCDDHKLKKIELFSKSIIEAINKYYRGDIYNAYAGFVEVLNNVTEDSKQDFVTHLSSGYKLYRARKESDNNKLYDYTNEDLFHIRFEDRTKVKNQRYSISGLPCLYMSESVYGCWMELGRPPLHMFTSAVIKTKDKIGVFDLGKMYSMLIEDNTDNKIRYATFLQLALVCSFMVNNRNDEFKPEYIIPQFILQWILNNKYGIRGIKYFSTISTFDNNNKRLFTNYVFPAQEVKESGFCSNLQRLFDIKRVVSGKTLQFYNKVSSIITVKELPSDQSESVELSRGLKRNYCLSMFGTFEDILTSNINNMNDAFYLLDVNREE